MADDVVATASVTIEPDLSKFGDMLQSALEPAMKDAASSVSDGTADMASEASTGAAAVGAAIAEGIAPGIAAALDAVTELGSVVPDVIEGLSYNFTDMGLVITNAAGEIVDAEGNVVDITGEVGDAFKDVTDVVGETMDGIGELPPIAIDAGEAMEDAGNQGSLGFDAATISAIALGSAIGDQISAGVDFALDKIADLATAIPDLGEEFDNAFDSVRVATGEVGEGFVGLQEIIRDVASRTPASIGSISEAVSDIAVRLDLTGAPLATLAEQVVRLSGLTGAPLQGVIKGTTSVFTNWGIETADQVERLNQLFRVSQETGAPVSDLGSTMARVGGAARISGLNFEETAAFIGLLTQAGLSGTQSQMFFAKVLKHSQDAGLSAADGFAMTFESIRNGTMSAEEGFDLFGARSVAIFELARSGKLDFDTLAESVVAGGDTISAAALATDDWREKLQIFTNQIKLQLEPIASFVFGRITDAVEGIGPIVVSAAGAITKWLTPAIEWIVRNLTPLWNGFDEVAVAIADFIYQIQEGAGTVEALKTVFQDLGLDPAIVDTLADAWGNFTDVLADFWTRTQPLRDGIAEIFETLQSTIGDFLDGHPEVKVGLLAGAMGGALFLAIGAVTSALGFLLGPIVAVVGSIVTAAAPLLLVGAAIGALAGGFLWAYQNVEPFRDAVDGAIDGVQDFLVGLMPMLTAIRDDLGAAFEELLPHIEGFWNALGGGEGIMKWFKDNWEIIAFILADVLTGGISTAIAAFIWAYQNVESFRDLISDLIGVLGDLAGGLIDSFTGVAEIIDGIFSGDWDQVQQGIADLAQGILDTFQAVIVDLPEILLEAIENLTGVILGALDDIPVLGNVFSELQDAIEAVSEVLHGLFDILGGIMDLDFDRVMEGLGEVFSGLDNIILSALQGIGGLLYDALVAALELGWTAIVDGLPALGEAFMVLLGNIPGWTMTALAALGQVIVDGLVAAWNFLVAATPTVLAGLGSFLAAIPGYLVAGLAGLGGFIVDAFIAAFDFLVSSSLTVLSKLIEWSVEIPVLFVAGLSKLGEMFYTTMFDAWGWVVSNGPGILLNVLGWFAGLPAQFVATFNNLGALIRDMISTAFEFVVTEGPTLLVGLLDWFGELPGKIFDAIVSGLSAAGGAATSIAGTIYNAIVDFINDHLVLPIREFEVSFFGKDYHPFGSLPTLPTVALAQGGILDEPTLAMIGEAGREAAVPLDDEVQGVKVARAAGIDQMLARAGALGDGGEGGTVINMQVEVTVESSDDPEEVGAGVGRGILTELRPLVRGA